MVQRVGRAARVAVLGMWLSQVHAAEPVLEHAARPVRGVAGAGQDHHAAGERPPAEASKCRHDSASETIGRDDAIVMMTTTKSGSV